MKRAGFSLMELMVVIAVIALLAGIVLPSMSRVYSMARATICRGNLQRISDAFATSGSTKALEESAGMNAVARAFPKPMAWPAVPKDVVDDQPLYTCPEDETVSSIQDAFKMLEYACPYGRFPMDTAGSEASFYISRVGEDDKGTYTDFMLQDDYGNGQYAMMDFHGWFDTDGFCRMYHSGTMWVFDRIPDTPEFSGAYGPGYPDRVNTCPDLNAIYWRGVPAFGGEGRLRNHRGKFIDLPDWDPGGTNYGINSYAHEYAVGADCIVLVDYKELIVEVDTPLETEELLLASGRHLGKLNYLRADGAVKTTTPMEISPRLNLAAWDPRTERDEPE